MQAGRYAALSQQSHRIHQRIQPFIVDERARIADAQGYGNIVWRGFDALAIHTIGQQGQATFGYIPPLSSIMTQLAGNDEYAVGMSGHKAFQFEAQMVVVRIFKGWLA